MRKLSSFLIKRKKFAEKNIKIIIFEGLYTKKLNHYVIKEIKKRNLVFQLKQFIFVAQER